ncbi:endonuclease/exonuclease/phosphatase family protein [Armatimonas sp.]|uniref:endonuclease/exonuclease/phosphatase family protein n=1 Tax=Armatimonas sp. TaxID=1872638 RepID=UPI00374D5E5E
MPLNVMTLNLLYAGAVNPAGSWSARLPLVLDVLRGVGGVVHGEAGIIALQEATAPQLRDLEHALPEFTILTGPESGETRMPRLLHRATRLLHRARAHRSGLEHLPSHLHAPRGEHCAILYRKEHFEALDGNAFWLSHAPHAPGSTLPGTWLPRVVNWARLQEKATGNLVTVYNAHLDFLPWAPLRSARILRHIMDTHWDGSPQVLLGDFNAPPRSAAYLHLGAELKHTPHPPLLDAWLAATERHGPEGTYHGGTGRIRWMGRLDRILFRPTLRVARVTTLTHHRDRFYPSDHYPVLAEFAETNEEYDV